jgi:rhamnopyranosyl-N-acetylglucosaminyl-diphospho-decaprenol beta-1,3/1,4-galactofuranosyltransferase
MSKVVAVTATYRRPDEVARLLAALEKSSEPLHGIVVVDNAGDAATRDHVEKSVIPHRYENAGGNLGCGGGLKRGEEIALREFPNLTHIWILDDDTVPEPNTLLQLLDALQAHDAGAACPQASDVEGSLNWFPGLLDRQRFDILRTSATPAEFIARGGSEPGAFSWATGVALLVTRGALDTSGLHRGDFWVRGEDLDFSLRITAHFRGLYVPQSHLAHLPPGGGRVVDDFPERMKHAAMLQNCAYLMTRTSHGRRLLRHWPGNAWRHLRRFGISALGDVLTALRLGALSGQPAGSPTADHFRRRLAAK